MGSPNTPNSTGTYSGNNGKKIYYHTHNDIDSSEIDITCISGAVEIILHERIWSEWKKRNSWNLSAPDSLNTTVDVDSAYYDGDHRLTVYARANGTKCTINFASEDW